METAIRSSQTESQAEEWALVLAAAGIPHRLDPSGLGWTLIVPDEDVARAREALDPYDAEARVPWRAGVAAPADRPTPWLLGTVVCLALLVFFVVTGPPVAGSRWFARGAAVAGLMTAEPWRAVTALTLHLDAAHAAGNAVAIAVVLPAVGQRFGAGVGLWLVVLGGAGGNLLAALLHAPGHMAAGASTAIFAAIGILGAARVFRAAGEERRRWKPWTVLAASLALLAILGTSPHADLVAHGTGFLSGAVVGLAGAACLRPFGPTVQWTVGALTTLAVLGCWLLA